MTFGETLSELLRLAGVKQAHLADYLGYDISYINKWLSGQKRPSVRNNSELFDKIAEFLVKNGGSGFASAVKARFGTDGPAGEAAVAQVLSMSYSPAANEPPLTNSRSGNSSFGTISGRYADNVDRLNGAIRSAMQKEECIEFISIPLPEHFGGNDAKRTWQGYVDALPPGKRIHICLAADFRAGAHSDDLYHDVMIFLYGFDGRISFDLFHTAAFSGMNQGVYICRGVLLTIMFRDVLAAGDSVLWSQDRELVNSYYNSAGRLISRSRQLIIRSGFDALYDRRYFRNFFFGSNVESFHTAMPLLPVQGAGELLPNASSGLDAERSGIWQYLCEKAPARNAAIYEQAVMNFVYDGRAEFFGENVTLSPEERRSCLSALADAIEDGASDVYLIEDNNPELSVAEIGCSVFVKRGGMFSFQAGGDVMFSSDEAFSDGLGEYLDKIKAKYARHGADAASFLRRCVEAV